MRKLWVIGGVVLAVLLAVTAVFLTTFDINRYRPLIVSKIEAALGMPVLLEHISLGWHGGISIRMKGLSIPIDKENPTQSIVQVEKVDLVVRLTPLLRREVELGVVQLTNATLFIGNLGFEPKLDLTVRHLDLTLLDVSQDEPIRFKARMALLSDQPNLSCEGLVVLPSFSSSGFLEEFRLRTDLSLLNDEEVARFLPAIEVSGLQRGFSGQLEVNMDRCSLDPRALDQIQAVLRLTAGKVQWRQLATPMENIQGEIWIRNNRLELKETTAQMALGAVRVSGTIEDLAKQAKGSLNLIAERLSLEKLLPPMPPDKPQLKGELSGSFQGFFQGKTVAQLLQSLSGEGQLRLPKTVIVNMNVLREVFGQLSLIPGAVEKIVSSVPEDYRQKFTAKDTVFEPIDLKIFVKNQTISMQDFRAKSDTFELSGSGRVVFAGTFDFPAQIRIDPILSSAIIRSVSEIGSLTDEKGRLQFPIKISGSVTQISVMPDIGYIASRMVQRKAEDLLGDLLEKALEQDKPVEQGSASGGL